MNSPCLRHGCAISAGLPNGQALRHRKDRRGKAAVTTRIQMLLYNMSSLCRRKWRACAVRWPVWPPPAISQRRLPARKRPCKRRTGLRPAAIVWTGIRGQTLPPPGWTPSFTPSVWKERDRTAALRRRATAFCRWMTAIPRSFPVRKQTTRKPMPVCMRISVRR